jgi:tRNA (cmo5U34)-methyltransferase
MLEKLAQKHAGRSLRLIRGSYFSVPFPGPFDAAISVQTMHHFLHEDKLRLYKKIREALKPGGAYVEADYVAPDEEYESKCLAELGALNPTETPGFFHFDIPMTIAHQIALLEGAGFSFAECIWYEPNTAILRAIAR